MVVTHFAQQFDHVVFVSLQPQKLILLIFVEASKARQADGLPGNGGVHSCGTGLKNPVVCL
jgi:hypothetical protein